MAFLGLIASALGLLVAGCGSDEPSERRDALAELVEALGLGPVPGEADVRVGRTQSESDYPYFTATGAVHGSLEDVVKKISRALERSGWEVVESGSDRFLGRCVRARRERMVARASVGWTRPRANGFDPYPHAPGLVYIQASIGRTGSNQQWADLTVPACR